MKKKLSLLILVACVIAATVNAQQIDQNSLHKIAQKVQPQGFDNHSFGIFFRTLHPDGQLFRLL